MRPVLALNEVRIGDRHLRLEPALAHDDRDGHPVDRDERHGDALDLARVGSGGGLGNPAKGHVDAVFAVGQLGAGARGDPHRLRLARRQRDAARGIANHLERGALLVAGLFLGHVDQAAVGQHATQLEADAVGRFLGPDVGEDHLGPPAAVEDHPRRRDQQVALGRQRRGGQHCPGGGKRGERAPRATNGRVQHDFWLIPLWPSGRCKPHPSDRISVTKQS